MIEQQIARESARSAEKTAQAQMEQTKYAKQEAEYAKQTCEAQQEILSHQKAQLMAMEDLINALQGVAIEQHDQNEILQAEIKLKNRAEKRERILFWVALIITFMAALFSLL